MLCLNEKTHVCYLTLLNLCNFILWKYQRQYLELHNHTHQHLVMPHHLVLLKLQCLCPQLFALQVASFKQIAIHFERRRNAGNSLTDAALVAFWAAKRRRAAKPHCSTFRLQNKSFHHFRPHTFRRDCNSLPFHEHASVISETIAIQSHSSGFRVSDSFPTMRLLQTSNLELVNKYESLDQRFPPYAILTLTLTLSHDLWGPPL